MEYSKVVKLIIKYLEKQLKDEKTPGVSYIVNRILSLPPLLQLLTSNFTPKEILEISYMVFFIFEGDDIVSAEWKSKNDLYFVDVYEIGDSFYKEIPCDTCDGSGEKMCEYCDGSGIDYNTNDDDCMDCYGSGDVKCDKCDGEGFVEDDEESVFFNREIWVLGNPETATKLLQIEKNEGIVKDFYDILDNDKGSVFLVKTIGDDYEMSHSDFEFQYGNYDDLQGEYILNSVVNLKNSNYGFKIDSTYKNNVTIK